MSLFIQNVLIVCLLCLRRYARHDGFKDEQTEVVQMGTFLLRSQSLPQLMITSVPEGQGKDSPRTWEELEMGRTFLEYSWQYVSKSWKLHIHDSAVSLLSIYLLVISTRSALHQQDLTSVWPAVSHQAGTQEPRPVSQRAGPGPLVLTPRRVSEDAPRCSCRKSGLTLVSCSCLSNTHRKALAPAPVVYLCITN